MCVYIYIYIYIYQRVSNIQFEQGNSRKTFEAPQEPFIQYKQQQSNKNITPDDPLDDRCLLLNPRKSRLLSSTYLEILGNLGDRKSYNYSSVVLLEYQRQQ